MFSLILNNSFKIFINEKERLEKHVYNYIKYYTHKNWCLNQKIENLPIT